MLAVLSLLACVRPASTADSGDVGACGTTPAGQVSLPADDAVHPDVPVEWWYWTGHLATADGRTFGFEHVFFSGKEGGVSGVLVHTALTDAAGGRFRHTIRMAFGAPTVVADGFQFSVVSNTADGGDGHDQLHGEPEDATFDLSTSSSKAPVLQGGTGYETYDFGGWTYYYSREQLDVTGTLDVDGAALPVTGRGWFDHQWGNLGKAVSAGWDWFSLQLDDGTDIMLDQMRPSGVTERVAGSVSDAACNVTTLGPDDFDVTPIGQWTSPHDGCVYPMGWDVTVQGKHYTVTADLPDQELPDAQPIYWEGASTVTGDATGHAYVELTGYCSAS